MKCVRESQKLGLPQLPKVPESLKGRQRNALKPYGGVGGGGEGWKSNNKGDVFTFVQRGEICYQEENQSKEKASVLFGLEHTLKMFIVIFPLLWKSKSPPNESPPYSKSPKEFASNITFTCPLLTRVWSKVSSRSQFRQRPPLWTVFLFCLLDPDLHFIPLPIPSHFQLKRQSSDFFLNSEILRGKKVCFNQLLQL